ncbi:MAG: hypothetical protein QOJ62_2746 [Actinomycetota bacterium]|jgi:CRP-like cAMP-binding protein|nr:hypothetical protein [Actinomycetota bacterium]
MAAALADHPFLSTMPPTCLRRLAVHAFRQDFPAGQSLFRESAVADRVFLIRRGLVKLDIAIPGRDRVDVELLGPDTVLGWSWLFPPYEWHLGATAIERTTALAFDASTLRALMASDVILGYELMRRFAAVMYDRLQATRLRLGTEGTAVPAASVSGPWAGRRTSALLSLAAR